MCTAEHWISMFLKRCEAFDSHFIFTKQIHTPSLSSKTTTKPMLLYSRGGSASSLYTLSVGFQESFQIIYFFTWRKFVDLY